MFSVLFIVACILYGCFNCAPTTSKYPRLSSTNALDFMKKFGYIAGDDGNSEALYTEEGISDIIKMVQKYGAIQETGKIDNATIKLMSSPRCGVPDIIRKKREKRFILGSRGWDKRNLTYFIANWTPKLGENSVMKNIQKALNTWGGYGRLNFQRVYTPAADIIVAFWRGYHGDSFPFDGVGNILAHAFFPQEHSNLGGDIHFDDDENWIDVNEKGTTDGTDFYSVALHELGHSLGLAHSPVPTSVMFPYYQYSEPGSTPQLSYDDILGMYSLYITRMLKEDYNTSYTNYDQDETTPSLNYFPTHETTANPVTRTDSTSTQLHVITETFTTKTYSSYTSTILYEGDDESIDDHKTHDGKHKVPKSNSPSLPDICDGHVDAVATLRDELFVFREQFIWRFKEKGKLEKGYPVPIREMFPKFPDYIKKIDAAYERPDGMMIIFIGNSFWVYDGRNFLENSPKSLTFYGLPNYLTNIDAVQTWGRNKKTYFYKSDRFWRYNETSKTMDLGYPLHMERWRGVPQYIDAATTWKDGVTYFFKGDRFWKFDNDWIMVTEQSPLPTAQIWFGCPEEAHRMQNWQA